MQQQNGTKEHAMSNTQSSVNETDKENSLADNIPLENGFVVRRRDGKWFTTLGDTVITDPTDHYTEQLTQIDEINYKLIVNIIIHVMKVMNTQQELSQRAAKQIDRMTRTGL